MEVVPDNRLELLSEMEEKYENKDKDYFVNLKENYTLGKVTIHSHQKSMDGTIKYAFKLYDGNIVEGVLIPTDTRMTACISSQVGCSLTCKFCATGKLDRIRNLYYWEIYDQVCIIKQQAITI